MNGNGLGPWLSVVSYSESLISTAGAVLIGQTARMIGLDRALSKMLAPRWAWWAIHDPGKIVADRDRGRAGRGLETEHPGQGSEEEQPSGKLFGSHGFAAYRQDLPPRQPPTLHRG